MVRHGPVAAHFLADHVLGRTEFFLVELGAAQRARLGADQLLGNRLTVDEQALVGGVANRVARQANHTLDVVDVRVARVAEHHHIAALRITDFDDFLVDHRQADPVGKLAHQDEVADIQGWLHRTGRNLERFHQERTQHQHDEQHREERLAVFNQQRLFVQLLDHDHVRLADAALIGSDGGTPTRGQDQQIEQRQQAADEHGDDQQQREI
ncbi:hypothetical protein D3C78_1167010 [compost metagenome]